MHSPYPKVTIAALTLCTVLATAFGEPQGQDEALGSAPTPPDSSFFVDPRDGKKYRTVKIGKQTWMAYNLNYKTGKSWCYDDDNSNCKEYGRLYDWNTAMKACPDGWRLPTREDWRDLAQAVGGTLDDNGAYWHDVGKKLKARIVWDYETYKCTKGTDSYGFLALPGGARTANGASFCADSDGQCGYWWTATENGDTKAYYMELFDHEDGMLEHENGNKDFGRSVRCLQNVTR